MELLCGAVVCNSCEELSCCLELLCAAALRSCCLELLCVTVVRSCCVELFWGAACGMRAGRNVGLLGGAVLSCAELLSGAVQLR